MEPTQRVRLARSLVSAFAFTFLASTSALAWTPQEVFFEGGEGTDSTRTASLGFAWDLPWQSAFLSGALTTRAEVFLARWRLADAATDRTLTQVGAVPYVRFRPDAGRSPWFIELGIGISVLDAELHTTQRRFGSRWNFSDNLAVGRDFGDQRQYSWSLRYQHTSNAGIKKPNPGMDLVQVRLSARF